jgi:hypothetical protein
MRGPARDAKECSLEPAFCRQLVLEFADEPDEGIALQFLADDLGMLPKRLQRICGAYYTRRGER